jgi:ribonuclease E
MTDQLPSEAALPPSSGAGAPIGAGSNPVSFSNSDESRPRDAHERDGDRESGVDAPNDLGAPSSADPDGAPRRRRRRGGRGRRRGRSRGEGGSVDSGAAPGVSTAEPEAGSSDDADGAPEFATDGPSAEANDADESPASPAPAEAIETGPENGERRRRRRGRRGQGRRRREAAERAAAAQVESGAEPAPQEAPSALPQDDAHDGDMFVAAPAEPTEERRSRRRRRGRGGRGRGRDARATQAPPPEASQTPSDVEAPAETPRPDGESGEGRQRRRRRGRGRGREAGPVGVEVIPGDDDELPAPPAPAPAPPAEAAQPRGDRRGRRDRRGERATEAAELDKPRAPKPGKRNVILVNAADREETRVAVVEDGQIVDFQMHVKRHETLVNDIYRGKVVNLEPAIGAAFIDFGQGRNGFLHTSDVLSVYGDKDWSLDKLLTHKIDPEEWDEKSSQPDVGVELSDARVRNSPEPRGQESNDHPENDPDAGEMEEVAALEAAAPVAHIAEASANEPEVGFAPASGEREQEPVEPAPERPAERARPAEHGRGHHGGHRRGHHRSRPRLPISDLLQKGQSVVVQVTKDAIGDKGPTLTTYISIPGRYLVLMPSMSRTGVSRKIDDEKERRRLKRILESLDVPQGMGVIVRTAGIGCTREDLKRDLDYLMLLWDSFGKRLHLGRGPAALYEESDVAIRTIRDLFNDHTEAVLVDDERVYNRVREFMEKLIPEKLDRVQLHQGPKPLFHTHNVEQDFERIFARRIDLPSGGSIVFDQAEALVAIDVNSGKTRTDGFDFEDVALRTNLDAVKEIARQIRLRDLGGIIVCDFIDMQRHGSRRQVERALHDAMASDRARSKLGRISQFGLLELTRQRLGPGLSKMLFHNCPRCRGSGRLRTVESRAGAILRRLGSALTLKGFTKVEVRTQPEVVDYLKRHYAQETHDLMVRNEREIELVSVSDQIEDSVLRYLRADGREVRPGGRRKR